MKDLIFSGTSRACLKISKSRSRAQKWGFRLNKEGFRGSDHVGVVDQTCSGRFEYLHDPILRKTEEVMTKIKG